MWDLAQFERHFNRGDGAEDHRLVQITHVPDPKHVATQSLEPTPQRHIELIETNLAYLVGIVAVGNLHGRDRIRLGARIDRKDLGPVILPPYAHGAPRCFGEAMMARENLVEAFLVDHSQ